MLEIRNLKVVFETDRGVVKAVNGIDLTLERGKILGLVGESGSGKSMTLLSILRLVPYPGKIVEGEILFEGEDLLKKSASQMREHSCNE